MIIKTKVLVLVKGKNIELFINKLIKNNVFFDNYKKLNKDSLIMRIYYEDYLSFNKSKSIYKITIIKKYGYIYFLEYINNDKSFFISLFLSLVMIFILSHMCFKINVIHSNYNVRKFIIENLEEYGIKKYKFIPNYDKRTIIINKILKKNKDKLEWLEIQKNGNVLNVRVNERKINKSEKIEKYEDVVAKKDGIIKNISSSQGEIIKEINDFVKKGDIIITGAIKKDDEVKKFVNAKGRVYAEVWYKVNVEYPLYYEDIKYYNSVKNKFVISIFNKEFKLSKNYEDNYISKNSKLIKSNIFPFFVGIKKLRKIKKNTIKLREEEALEYANDLAEKKILNNLKKDEYIISKNTLNFHINSSKIYVDVFFKVYEDITNKKEIDIKSYINETKE